MGYAETCGGSQSSRGAGQLIAESCAQPVRPPRVLCHQNSKWVTVADFLSLPVPDARRTANLVSVMSAVIHVAGRVSLVSQQRAQSGPVSPACWQLQSQWSPQWLFEHCCI